MLQRILCFASCTAISLVRYSLPVPAQEDHGREEWEEPAVSRSESCGKKVSLQRSFRIVSVHPFDLSFCSGKQAADIFMVPQNNKNCQYCRSPKHAAVDVDIHDIDDGSTGRENAGQRDDLKCR